MEDKTNPGSAASETKAASAKKAKTTLKVQRAKSTHPPTSEMVNAAIKELKDRKGSSLQAIKKYIAATYKVDGEKLSPFIKRYLKTAVTSGAVVQTKGKGASGSFKLSTGTTTQAKPKKVPRTPKKAAPKKIAEKKIAVAKKTAVAKKAAGTPKKAAATEKKPAAAKAAAAASKKTASARITKAAAQAKSLSKAKKTTKAPAAKTKTPKPKKTATSKAAKSSAKK